MQKKKKIYTLISFIFWQKHKVCVLFKIISITNYASIINFLTFSHNIIQTSNFDMFFWSSILTKPFQFSSVSLMHKSPNEKHS